MQVNGMGGGGGQGKRGTLLTRKPEPGNRRGKDSRRDPFDPGAPGLRMTLLRPAGYGGQASGGYAGLRRGRFSRGFAALIPGFWTAWRITEGPPCPGPIRVAEKRVFGRFLCPQQGPPHCGTPPQRVPGDGLGGQKIGLFSAVMCTPLRPMAYRVPYPAVAGGAAKPLSAKRLWNACFPGLPGFGYGGGGD